MNARNRLEEVNSIISDMRDSTADKKLIGLCNELLEKSEKIIDEF